MNNNCVCGVPAERCTLIIADKGFLYNTERKEEDLSFWKCVSLSQLLHLSTFTCHILSPMHSGTAKRSSLPEIRVELSIRAPPPPLYYSASTWRHSLLAPLTH